MRVENLEEGFEDSKYHREEEKTDTISKKSTSKSKRSYVPVELSKREDLVRVIEEERITIKEAALKLGINYSTAKHIMKTYKKTGEV
mmetsp:Transcript_23658/g.18099  ORF Transcript_23658/g.18099 Transcript_23658/m.18099 type:complete len:87 (-) Transcript_23658:730-990(-)|eukprot:CAMPEP_0202969032 /NCGR_PEP_ID=MMETSP1396-20130829/14622_1 /ASSEMBLY_ACC=CAM_ASM_000872 /TAXON_ID= /ORGANISM="Pseudokeronopsis sp., Strain Brazil" /LENGTH=86 /DNA_ID=CAMNT_0049696103 /DNA_START=63 /DNA_END=323 /DNA_ORIENTATION=-